MDCWNQRGRGEFMPKRPPASVSNHDRSLPTGSTKHHMKLLIQGKEQAALTNHRNKGEDCCDSSQKEI